MTQEQTEKNSMLPNKHTQRFVQNHEPNQRKSTAKNVQDGKAKFGIIVFWMTAFYSLVIQA